MRIFNLFNSKQEDNKQLIPEVPENITPVRVKIRIKRVVLYPL